MALTLQQAPARLPWSPAVRALLWMDAVLLLGAALALAGRPPALGDVDLSTWLVLAGSTLTSVLAALAAFHLCSPRANPAWTLLPVPPIVSRNPRHSPASAGVPPQVRARAGSAR